MNGPPADASEEQLRGAPAHTRSAAPPLRRTRCPPPPPSPRTRTRRRVKERVGERVGERRRRRGRAAQRGGAGEGAPRQTASCSSVMILHSWGRMGSEQPRAGPLPEPLGAVAPPQADLRLRQEVRTKSALLTAPSRRHKQTSAPLPAAVSSSGSATSGSTTSTGEVCVR